MPGPHTSALFPCVPSVEETGFHCPTCVRLTWAEQPEVVLIALSQARSAASSQFYRRSRPGALMPAILGPQASASHVQPSP